MTKKGHDGLLRVAKAKLLVGSSLVAVVQIYPKVFLVTGT